MIKTSKMLLEELKDYKNPKDKISRMVKNKEIIPIVAGLYETDSSVNPRWLASCIYGPSYISFDYALSEYGLIPEAVYAVTSATCEKRRRKQYNTPFGVFMYRDVPTAVYPMGIRWDSENGYPVIMATPEKALCDKLYTISPVHNQKELQALLFDDLRIYPEGFSKLNKDAIINLATKYKSRNVQLLAKFVKKSNKYGL